MLNLKGLVRNSDKENVTEEAKNNVSITVVANSLVSNSNSVSKISLFPSESHLHFWVLSGCLPFFPLPVTAVTVAIS